MKLSRFTLHDLFWLVLVCALAVGWWVERANRPKTLVIRDHPGGGFKAGMDQPRPTDTDQPQKGD